MGEHARFQKLVTEAKKNITEISPQDAAAKLKSGEAVVVDVRDKDEWDEGHIPGALHMSRGTIEHIFKEKVTDTNTMIICYYNGDGQFAILIEKLQKKSFIKIMSTVVGLKGQQISK